MRVPNELMNLCESRIAQRYGGKDQMMKAMKQMNHPVLNNAIDMYQRGDINGLNRLLDNTCSTNNINPESVLRNMFGR